MSGAIFALIACFLASIGARDQMLLAALTHRQGWRATLVVIAIATGAVASVVAAFAAHEAGGEFNHAGRLVVAAIGLGLAGGESLLRRPRRVPEEPTSSLFAAMLVLLADQITDPARFIVLALAISTEQPAGVAAGGIVGSGAALVLGAVHARTLLRRQHILDMARRLAGVLLLCAGVGLALWTSTVVAHN